MSNRINNAQRQAATNKMTAHVYEAQFLALTEKYKTLLSDILNATMLPGHKAAQESDVDRTYFNTCETFNFTDINDNSVVMYEPTRYEFKLPTGIRKRRGRVSINTPERLAVPHHFYGTVKLAWIKNKQKAKSLQARYEKLRGESQQLAKEIDEYHSSISSILSACSTMKKVEQTFPAAVKFFPTPQQAEAAKLPVPVELINSLTEKLNAIPA